MSSTALGDVLDAQRDEERRRAARALLRHPLLAPSGPDPAAYGLVRRHGAWLSEWLMRETGWLLHVDAGVARLRKIAADARDTTRGATSPGKGPLSRRRYVLACLALAALERAESQITLGRLVERLLVFAADPALAKLGVTFALETRDERSDLVAVARLLLEIGVLRKVAGDEQAFVTQSGDALYDLDRRVLAVLLVARRGPSLVTERAFEGRLAALTEEPPPDTDEGRNRAIRQSLARRLLDDPVLYYADLTEAERTYLTSQRAHLLRRLTEATGLIAEVRAEGIALIDPSSEATDLGMPEEGTDGHATLLVAEHLAAHARDAVPVSELEAHVARLAQTHRAFWRKNATLPGAERALTALALERLAALSLIRREGDAIVALPALARFGYAAPTIAGRSADRSGA